ncbi:MAG: hypothetical protein U0R28_03840 [Candidatus Nanopelagicales bacterium]
MSGGPLRSVLAAVDGGALTVLEIRCQTGLSDEMVRSALEQLQRMGMLTAEQVAVGCPPAGCGGCAVTSSCQPGLIGLSRVAG